jgi:hypothetical protein
MKNIVIALSFIALTMNAVFLLCVETSQAHVRFPSVEDLEASFHFFPGVQLPRDVQAADGTIYHSYYIKGKELGDGYYEATLRLAR